MEEWKEYKLEETTDFIAGYAFKSKDFGSYENKVVKIKDIQPPFVSIASIDGVNIHEYDISKLAKYLVYKNDFLLAMTGATIGKIGRYIYDKPVYLNQRILKFMPKVGFDSDFIYYSLISDSFQKFIINHIDSDSAQPNISANTIGKYRLYIPDITIQKKISHVLKVLDSKIELNRRINDNLEQQAQALFKSWFVDFEPFKDGKFVDSEMGMIPEGWKVVQLGEIIEISKRIINPQKNPDKIFYHYSLPACDNGLIPEIQSGKDIMSNKIILQNNTILFSKLNPRIKRIWFACDVLNDSICSTEFIPYRAKNERESVYIYSIINSDSFYASVLGCVNGATGSHQRFHAEDTLGLLFPYKKDIVDKYIDLVKPVLAEIHKLRIENKTLALTRDSLLPRLMSGELKFNDLNN